MSEKIKVYENIEDISPNDSLGAIIAALQSIEQREKNGELFDVSIEISSDYEYDHDWHIVGYRMETDSEYNIRMKQLEHAKELMAKNDEKAKAANEARDLKEYKRLKKKFEGKGKKNV